jgi:hypothetical protein
VGPFPKRIFLSGSLAKPGDGVVKRKPLPRTIEDQESLPDMNGLGNHRTEVARTQESDKISDDVDEKDDEIAHLLIITKHGIAWD